MDVLFENWPYVILAILLGALIIALFLNPQIPKKVSKKKSESAEKSGEKNWWQKNQPKTLLTPLIVVLVAVIGLAYYYKSDDLSNSTDATSPPASQRQTEWTEFDVLDVPASGRRFPLPESTRVYALQYECISMADVVTQYGSSRCGPGVPYTPRDKRRHYWVEFYPDSGPMKVLLRLRYL